MPKSARLVFFYLLASGLQGALIDDFQDVQGPQTGPGCSAALTVTASGADRQLCPGGSAASMEVAGGLLDILNSGAGGGASVLTYLVPTGLAGAYTGFYLDVVQSDGQNLNVGITAGGSVNATFVLPGNTSSSRIDFLAPGGGFTLAAGDLITITFSGSPGWDLTLGPTLQASAFLGVAATGEEGIGLIAAAAAVPEPAPAGLLLLGAALACCVAVAGRRRRRSACHGC